MTAAILTSLTLLAIVVAIFLIRKHVRQAAAEKERRRRWIFIRSYVFPPGLARRLRELHPALSDADISLTLEGLRQFFLACLSAQRRGIARQVGMPSKVVDDAWHELILMTRHYDAFCQSAFGRYLHHTPKEQMVEPLDRSLANTLHQLKQPAPAAGTLAMLGAMPLIFALDRHLNVADGYRYDQPAIDDLERKRKSMLVSGDGGGSYATGGDSSSGSVLCGDGASGAACDSGGGDGGSGCGGGGCGGGGCGGSD
jgi:hypothetical protein